MGVWGQGGSWVHITATHASPPPPQGQRGQGSCCRGEIRDYEHTASRGRCRCCTSWGGRGGHVRLRPAPPPHTLQSTGQQQRPHGVQSWVSILVPALLHELGGLRQPPPRQQVPRGWGGSSGPAQVAPEEMLAWGGHGSHHCPPLASGPPRVLGGGHLWSCSWRASPLAPWGHVRWRWGGVGKQNLGQVGMDPAPRIWSRCSGGGGRCPMSPWGRQVGPGGDEMAGGGGEVV